MINHLQSFLCQQMISNFLWIDFLLVPRVICRACLAIRADFGIDYSTAISTLMDSKNGDCRAETLIDEVTEGKDHENYQP